jgi:maltooligosyltrehalose trehalohydrolase
VRAGRRREFAAFGWDPDSVPDPQDVATFTRSRLDWSELAQAPHRDLLDWHRELIALRRRLPALRDGHLDRVVVEHDDAAGWLTMQRGGILVVANFADEGRQVPVGDLAGRRCVLCAPDDVTATGGVVSMPPHGVAIYA